MRVVHIIQSIHDTEENTMKKKLLIYLGAFARIFVIILLVSVFAIQLTWGEGALLSVFLAAIGVGTYWWREEGLG